ncbi:HpcH/HpaI aldolase/citrate lyase family protein, partial [uncultured Caballeronia sp.]|uniref:HpcH/HpaI aldolase/citrate lyase family protein n=1 Tax=uncultured Caballeronia sp. TaxID=1827198 RepID=UPI0035CB4852
QFPRDRVMVRVNAAGTEWHEADIHAVKALGVRDIMLPKSEDPDKIASVAQQLGDAVSITALVESTAGIWCALDVARAPNVRRLAFGSIDFALDACVSLDTDALLYARSRLVLASRIANLPQPVDGVTAAIDNSGLLEQETQAAGRMGFGGKLCIHPRQIDIVNRVFRPSDEEVAWARETLAAAGRADGAAVKVNGQMIDLPIIKRAARIVALADRVTGVQEPFFLSGESRDDC